MRCGTIKTRNLNFGTSTSFEIAEQVLAEKAFLKIHFMELGIEKGIQSFNNNKVPTSLTVGPLRSRGKRVINNCAFKIDLLEFCQLKTRARAKSSMMSSTLYYPNSLDA